MALKGTQVGQAYVAMHVDGTGINEAITKNTEDAAGKAEKAGGEHAKKYSETFNQEVYKRIGENLDGALASKFGDRLGPKIAEGLKGSLDKELSGSLASGTSSSLLQRLIGGDDESLQRVSRNTAHKLVSTMRKEIENSLESVEKDLSGAKLGLLLAGPADTEAIKTWTAAVNKAETGITHLKGALTEAENIEKLFSKATKASVKDLLDLSTLGEKTSKALGGESGHFLLGGFGQLSGGIVNETTRSLSFMGTVIGGVIKEAGVLFNAFTEGFTLAGENATTLTQTLAGMEQVTSKIGTQLSGIGSAIAEAIISFNPASLIATAAVVAILVASASVLVSILGAILGLLTAIAAEITAGITGALLVAGAAMGAFAAAAGLAYIAFKSMTDAQKGLLNSAFGPLKDEMAGLGHIMLASIVPAFKEWSANLQVALALVRPLAAVMGPAFADLGRILTSALSGPGVQQFITTLGTTLPLIVRQLGTTFSGLFNAFGVVFARTLPFLEQFTHYLAEAAIHFQNWAQSAAGQNAIADFVARAVTALQSLWGFLNAVGDYLGRVFFSHEALNAGGSIFDGMRDAFNRFTSRITDGSLDKWFNDALQFGQQLWYAFSQVGEVIGNLYSSGVLQAVGQAINDIGIVASVVATPIGWLARVIGDGLGQAADAAAAAFDGLVLEGEKFINMLSRATGHKDVFDLSDTRKALADDLAQIGQMTKDLQNAFGFGGDQTVTKKITAQVSTPGTTGSDAIKKMIADLLKTGHDTRSQQSRGDFNPYRDWANSLINEGPTIAAQIRNALVKVNGEIQKAVHTAGEATSAAAVESTFTSVIDSMTTSAQETVNTAQQALTTAARTLAGETNKANFPKELAAVQRAQIDLAAAIANQAKISAAANALAAQEVVTQGNVAALVAYGMKATNVVFADGFRAQNFTLADFAEARKELAAKLQKANQELTAAMTLRDSYQKQITDSIIKFGDLTSLQIKTVNGVAQAISSTDIIDNLQTRLKKIQDFQKNLQVLLAQGLSNDAYKQLVDAGPDQGGQFAAALVAGGPGAVGQVNSLTSQISGVASSLGKSASSRLYQAGVDAAQGLVDGLTSLSGQLDAAAEHLGQTIANSLKASLGIASPSRVMIAQMQHVGDGLVVGLDQQHAKVGSAMGALAGRIGVSPGSAQFEAYMAQQGGGVSGNTQNNNIHITTPTSDPGAVAHEVLNTVVGALV